MKKLTIISCFVILLLSGIKSIAQSNNATDKPLNILPQDASCFGNMSADIQFGIKKKFETPHTDYIDGMSIPLVADLNGDGKPEIIALGITDGTNLAANGRYIYIFDGQKGKRILRFDFQTLGYANGAEFAFRDNYHNSPSYLAIADLDRDGIAEIVVTETGTLGRVYALKPVLDQNGEIVNLVLFWAAGVGHKAPLTGLGCGAGFGYPMPYIADLNGDHIPEVIVNNKIYNGLTGDLLMAWGGPAATPTASTLAANTGLLVLRSGTAYTSSVTAASLQARAYTGRRPANAAVSDEYLGCIAVEDIDGCGQMEVIAGMRIYKFQFNSLTDHTQNTYTTIEGPASVVMPTSTATKNTFYLSDGFTSVADIDGDDKLDIIVQANVTGANGNHNTLIVIWDWESKSIKAASHYRSNGTYGTFAFPLIGDINDRMDGWNSETGTYDRKLPEICIITGRLYQLRTNTYSGIPLHPLSDFTKHRFNNDTGKDGHIFALTYDASETDIAQRLKVSWALEHSDNSNNTGVTMFDFDNDGANDLCYRDVNTLRVISPKNGRLSGKPDYIFSTDGETHPAILFKSKCLSRTGYETAVIADINADGSADIILTDRAFGTGASGETRGWISVFEYSPKTPKWTPCPPVWNQALYNPLHVNGDLTIPAKPQSKLTTYLDANDDTIQPFNGTWTQQPIVKENNRYIPVVRLPDADLTGFTIEAGETEAVISLTVNNSGLGTIVEDTPISFYCVNENSENLISVILINDDIFPAETKILPHKIKGDFRNKEIIARIMDDGNTFPAEGYGDCNFTNNTLSSLYQEILPITLLWFKGECKNDNIFLSWSTATESNNNYFTVLGSEDGLNYTPLATFAGAGNSNRFLEYRQTIPNSYNSGILYLRLKETDYDGTEITVKTIAVSGCNTPHAEAVWVYPNPAGNSLTINSSYPVQHIEILDITGRIINSGNFLNQDSFKIVLDVSDWLRGMYILRVYTSDGKFVTKFLKS